jgi:hypothetical protein
MVGKWCWFIVCCFSLEAMAERSIESYQVRISSVQCKEGITEDRRCIFENLILKDSKIYYIYPDKGQPPLMNLIRTCVDHLDPKMWPLWQPSFVRLQDTNQWNVTRAPFEKALLWRFLNPRNLYHVLFDDYGPLLRLRSFFFKTPIDGRSDEQLLLLNGDQLLPGFKEIFRWMFIRDVCYIQDYHSAIQVSHLAVGTQSTCGHRGHCLHRMESGSLIRLRASLFKHLESDHGVRTPAPAWRNISRGHLKIGVIQRELSRRFENLTQVMAENKFLKKLTPIYLEKHTIVEQARIVSPLDVLVMMHGGAIGNWLFLKPGSVVIDVRPFGYHHPLTQWIAQDLQGLNITFISFTLTEEATHLTPLLTNHLVKLYDDKSAYEKDARASAPAWKCLFRDPNKQTRCRELIFLEATFNLNPREVSELLDLAMLFVGRDHGRNNIIKAESHGGSRPLSWSLL